jgi:hypothetical protein
MILSARDFAGVVNFLKRHGQAAAGAEKRRTTRLEIQCKLVVAVPRKDGSRTFTTLGKDISLEGVGLLSSVALPKAQEIVLYLPQSDVQTLLVLSTVMFCAPIADGIFTLGCRFDRLMDPASAAWLDGSGKSEQDRIRKMVCD